MQIFNLNRLRSITPSSSGINMLTADVHYSEMTNSHNIVANEETDYIYAVGTATCNSGLHIIDVKNPLKPEFVSCFKGDGYVHDAQCVIYKGPDKSYYGREICFCYNEDTLTIVDVENKMQPKIISRTGYNKTYYTHQVNF